MNIRIEDWSLVYDDLNTYLPPELIKVRLNGKVYGHPRFEDGYAVTTSSIIGEGKAEEGGLISTKSGSTYILGKMLEGYAEYVKSRKD